MSTLRTFNLQNPDSGTVNIEMDQGGNTLMTGIATVRGAAHFTSTSGSDAVGIGTDITAYKLDVRVTGAEAGLRVYNPDTSSNASGILRLGNDDNQNSAFLMLNGANNSSSVGGAANLVLGTGTAREVHLATSGTSRLQITSAGNVQVNGGNVHIDDNGEFAIFETDTNLAFTNSSKLCFDFSSNVARIRSSVNGSATIRDIGIFTGNSERLRITSAGVVNIGDSSPNADGSGALNVYSGTSGALSQFVHSAGNGGLRLGGTGPGSAAHLVFSNDYNNNSWTDEWTIRMDGSDDSLRFLSGGVTGTERLRIDSSGRIAQGGRTPTNHGSPNFLIWGSDPTVHLTSTGSTANTSYTGIKFAVAGGSTGDYSKAGIFVQRQDSYNDLDMIFAFRSSNDATGVSVSDEKIRITSDGKVGVGVAAPTQMMEIVNTSGTGSQIQFRDTSTAQGNNNGARFGYNGSGAQIWNFENTYIRFATNNVERLRITSDGILSGGSASSTGGSTLIENRYSDPHILNILGSMYSSGNTTLTYGLRPKSGGSGYVSSFANFSGRRAALQIGQGTFEFYSTGPTNTAVGNDVTTTRNMLLNHDGKLEVRYDNSGGVGAYLSLQNRGTATGTRTGISFSVGNSDAILNATDYGEAEIHVYRDGGGHGNFDFRCHTGANRSWLKIIGNGQNEGGAGAGTEGMRGGVAFGCAGVAIDRSWMGQPGIHVFNQNVEGDTDQGTFRFHGWNRSYASYPGSSGSDFGVNVVGDGSGFSSDERKKTGITTITNALNTVSQMRGVSYQFVNSELTPQTHMTMDNGTKLGFIAQEVIPLLPSIVIDAGGENAVPHDNGWCDRYAIDYGSVTALLVEAIKELKSDKEALEARIASLEGS